MSGIISTILSFFSSANGGMWRVVALCLSVLVVVGGWLYRGATEDLAATKTSLTAAEAANESNRAAIERLERSLENTNAIMAGWDADRTTFAGIRNTTRQAIKEAIRDETVKAWASGVVPPYVWLRLGEAPDQNGNGYSGPAGRASGGLPGNADTGKRQ